MEKVSRGRQDAMQSEEVTEALECLLNGRLLVESLQSLCKALHSDVVAVRLQRTRCISLRFWLQMILEMSLLSVFPSRLTRSCLSPGSLWSS